MKPSEGLMWTMMLVIACTILFAGGQDRRDIVDLKRRLSVIELSAEQTMQWGPGVLAPDNQNASGSVSGKPGEVTKGDPMVRSHGMSGVWFYGWWIDAAGDLHIYSPDWDHAMRIGHDGRRAAYEPK